MTLLNFTILISVDTRTLARYELKLCIISALMLCICVVIYAKIKLRIIIQFDFAVIWNHFLLETNLLLMRSKSNIDFLQGSNVSRHLVLAQVIK